MPGGLSVDSTFKLAKQSAQGTAATSGFLCGLLEESGMATEFTYAPSKVEHGCTVSSHFLAQKSRKRRVGQIANGQIGGNLYPRFFTQLLYGLGFGVATSGTTIKTNVFTLGTATAAPYLTALSKVGSDAERRFTDVRVSSLTVTFSPENGVSYQASLIGLDETDPTGSETVTNELGYLMTCLGANGSVAMNYDPAGANTAVHTDAMEVSLTFDNPLDSAGVSLRSMKASGLYHQGMRVTGNLRHIGMATADYNRSVRGSTSGTTVSAATAVFSLDLKAVTTEIISASTPFSWQINFPLLNVDLDPASRRASGNGIIYFNSTFELEASGATPLTITGVSDTAA